MRAAPDSAHAKTRSPQLVSLNLLPALDLTEARTSQPLQLEITVRYSSGAYNTNQVFGFRSSSTSSARQAAEAQATKVYGLQMSEGSLMQLPSTGGHLGTDVFKVSARLPIAWCGASGLVDVGHVLPDDAMPIAMGPRFNLLKELDVACRHGKGPSKGLLLVPGIPEAPNEQEGLRALRAFIQWRCIGAKKLRSLGITYATYPGSTS
jgi:hypothetical protein